MVNLYFYISNKHIKKFMKPYVKVVVVSILISVIMVIILKEFGFDSSAVAIACGSAGGISGALSATKGKE